MKIEFLNEAWYEYVGWQRENKNILKRINRLIKSIQRNGIDSGIGKTE